MKKAFTLIALSATAASMKILRPDIDDLEYTQLNTEATDEGQERLVNLALDRQSELENNRLKELMITLVNQAK